MTGNSAFRLHRDAGMQVLLTAAEGFPAFERACLGARREIRASFRIFDLTTRLRSAEGRRIGATWFDLLVHLLRRGVRVHLTVSDFDPAARPELHRKTWRTLRHCAAAREAAGAGAVLEAVAAMHPARMGLLPRVLTWPLARRKLARQAGALDALPAAQRERALAEMPGLRARLREDGRGRLRAPLWPPSPVVPATHHQKIAVIDRRLLYIGGLDLNERRFDTPGHDRPGGETWQDVQILTDGPAVEEAQRHLEEFLDVTAGRAAPFPARHILRTLSAPARGRPGAAFRLGPRRVETSLLDAHEGLAARSRRLIYLETQYFRDTRLARALAGIGRRNPGLRLILVLPAAPDDIAFDSSADLDARYGEKLQARSIRLLRRGFGERFFAFAPAQPRRHDPRRDGTCSRACHFGAPLVYIHAKVSIFDDEAAIVSSANLNGRSLRWDTEAGLRLSRPEEVTTLRRRIFAHWLPGDAGARHFAPETALEAWRALALDNARRAPEARRGFLLPFDLDATESWSQALPGLPEEIV